eukprot:3597628-Pleurochrysis_carterae.AAC.1
MQAELRRPLWGALLRAARRFDRTPELRLLLAAPRNREFDLTGACWSELPQQQPASSAALAAAVKATAVRNLCGGMRLYSPLSRGSARSLTTALRDAMRAALPGADPALLSDAGFHLLRLLSLNTTVSERVVGPDFPAPIGWRGLQFPLHDRPRAGHVLVSHPMMRRDVVLLLSADVSGYAFGQSAVSHPRLPIMNASSTASSAVA